MTEKRKPHYNLAAIQGTVHQAGRLSHHGHGAGLCFWRSRPGSEGVVALVGGVQRNDFVKSMTSFGDHRIWHDVYHLPFEDTVLYVKFTKDKDGFYLLISLKDR